jgi:vacuolar protein sorting-associated protein 45
MLQQLAEADELEVVRQVQEFYGDFLAINPNLFELDIHSSLRLCLPPQDRAAKDAIFKRTVDGITAVLLALKKKPVIRFQNSSHLARQVATQLTEVVSDSLFDFRQPSSAPVLLLLDRREDPVTPLLSQWTYQAQVHELLGIQHNRVNMENAPGITKDLAQVVLSITQDDFFCKHMHSNFGDLGLAVKAMLDEYQVLQSTHSHCIIPHTLTPSCTRRP